MTRRKISVALLCLIVADLFLLMGSGRTAGISDAFFEAENCAIALRNNPKAMKYRDKWEQCIDKFQTVYRKEPKGPWAPASLYNTGLLYLELFKYSRNETDHKKGVELLEQILKKFPGSAYRERAAAELQKSSPSAAAQEEKPVREPSPKTAVAKDTDKDAERKKSAKKTPVEVAPISPAQAKYFKTAEACFNKLIKSKPRETSRRDWMLCVGRFHNAYLEDPDGPLSAQALYMEGLLYNGLHKGLKFDSDQRAARENFEKIIKEYPESPFAAKASRELQAMTPAKKPLPQALARRPAPPPALPGADEPSVAASPPADPPERRTTAPGEEGLAVVHDLRYWSNPNYTRVVVYADRETDYNHHLLKKDPALDKPPRLYVDLSNSTMDERVQANIPINDDLLSNARAARYSLDSVRVVVDIRSFETYKVFSLRDPFRIVIDVWGKNGAAQVAQDRSTDSAGSAPGSEGRSQKIPRSALAKQLALGVRRIVVDPGHGGKDFGAPGFIPGVHEKDVVLSIAKRVAGKIQDDLGLEAILTRTSDRYLTLEERTAFANTHNADLFVSIHTNASRDPRAYGMETYFLNLATDDEAIRVAAMENATSTKNISDLHSILNDLLKNAKINESSRLAELVQGSLVTNMRHRGYHHLKDKGVKQAPFYVLLGARMPSILVETSFISNREECRLLITPSYQEHLAESIIKGIRDYIREINPTAFSPPGDRVPG